jgi:hypothetical protein
MIRVIILMVIMVIMIIIVMVIIMIMVMLMITIITIIILNPKLIPIPTHHLNIKIIKYLIHQRISNNKMYKKYSNHLIQIIIIIQIMTKIILI